MNFFKRQLRRTTVSVLDDTCDEVNGSNQSHHNSAGLKHSGGASSTKSYHDCETKLFEEPPFVEGDNNEVNGNGIQNSGMSMQRSPRPEVIITAPSDVSNIISHQFNANNNYHLSPNNIPQETNPAIAEESVSDNGTTASNEERANQLVMIYASIIRGEKSAVKKLLQANSDLVEAPDNFGRTPLMYCVLSDRLDCAKLLLKMKCKLDSVDNAGRSALHLAAHKASYKFLELLHERGGNIEMKDNDGQTPLHLTTRNRHARCLDFLLKRLSPGLVEVTDNQKRTALHWSAAFNNTEYVKLLIKYNCNTALSDIEGKTPLHWAANSHDPSAVRTMEALLESAPSALNWQDYEGRTALHFAVAHGNVAAVKYLLSFGKDKCELNHLDNTFRTPLHWAAQLGNTEIVKLLLTFGAKNTVSDGNSATPLLYAALHNKPDVVMEMIKHDPVILDQVDVEGRNALMWAAGKGANDVIHLLCNLGTLTETANTTEGSQEETTGSTQAKKQELVMVDVNRTDNKGNTALHMAAWSGCARSAELLLNFNARHDLQNNMNHTPLFGACEKGHLSVVKHFLDHNASILLSDLEERSPLHWAALGGHAEICDLLIKKGLDPDLRDVYQRSPLLCAAFGGFINCMNLLLETKAKVDLQDQEGLSALHWAAQSGHLDAIKLLFQCSAFPNLMEYTEERLTPLDHALLNERDEVAQYLIEQGALSSETIRDIAAARIQACFRGHQVRKEFLHRKEFLVRHDEMLRNKNKKDKEYLDQILKLPGQGFKRNAITSDARNRSKNKAHSSTDHLNFVAEEPAPIASTATSVMADSLYSADESHTDQYEEQTLDMKTIHSTSHLSNARPCHELGVSALDSEGSNGSVKIIEKYEDKSPSELSIGIFTSNQQTIEVKSSEDSGIVVHSGECEGSVPMEAVKSLQEETELPLSQAEFNESEMKKGSAANSPSNNKQHESPENNFTLLKKATMDRSSTDECYGNDKIGVMSPAGSLSEAAPRETDSEVSSKEKPKKKKKSRSDKVTQSTVSEKSFVESEKDQPYTRKEATKKRRNPKAKHAKSGKKSSSIQIPNHDRATETDDSFYSKRKSSTSLSSSSITDAEKCSTAGSRITSASSKGEVAGPSLKKLYHHHSVGNKDKSKKSLNDEEDQVDHVKHESISIDKSSGMAYKAEEAADCNVHDMFTNGTWEITPVVNSDLSLSEYIEGLMSLSAAERKVLIMLQRHRKLAFKQANFAALIIQKAWRRFLKRKYPHDSIKKQTDFAEKNNEASKAQVTPVENATSSDSQQPHVKSGIGRPTKSGMNKLAVENKTKDNKVKTKVVHRKPSNGQKAEKSLSIRQKQPRATINVKESRQVVESRPSSKFEAKKPDLRRESLVSLASDGGIVNQKKLRPKTSRAVRKKQKPLLSPQDVALKDKIQQMCKVYGQTLVLNELYTPERKMASPKTHFQTVASPSWRSVRPKTSAARRLHDFDDSDFEDNRFDEPVTAVQSYTSPEKKIVKSRYDDPSLRNHSKPTSILTRRKSRNSTLGFDESDVAYLPLQWQKMYGDLKLSSLLNPNQKRASTRTRFSYNMHSANF